MLAPMKAPVPERSILPVTLGTAGHIDHGKTTLLRALSGGECDTDRLAEERERGLTIDVGYAELDIGDGVEVGVVDVPGHEKFVRNMVAGATGIDVVLLVVAADDGVMPQTREHLQIMSLLGLGTGVVAVTKCDMVDDEMVELVRSDVEDLLAGTFLDGATMVSVSSQTGMGLEALRTEIARLVRDVPGRDADGFFRMPVLRVFTSPGFGTVVTGIPLSGRLALGDRVEVQPGARGGRVRGLQVYHQPAGHASAGHRTAINVAELEHRKVARGDVICTPKVFEGASLLDVRLELLPELTRPLRHNQEVRLHVGTLECDARVLLLRGKHLEQGGTAYAQLKLSREAVVAPGDRFIVRLPAQSVTLGGGSVLGPGAHRRRKRSTLVPEYEERERGLADPAVALASALRRAGLQGGSRTLLARELKRREKELEPLLAASMESGGTVELARGLLLHGEVVTSGEDAILGAIAQQHEREPLALGVKKALLADRVQGAPAVVDALVDRLVAAGRVDHLPAGRVRLHGREPDLTAAQRKRRDVILELLGKDPWQTPRVAELPELTGGTAQEVDLLLALLEDQGEIVRLRDGIVFLVGTVDEAKGRIREHMASAADLSPADLRNICGLTRKYGIPLLEHLDTIGFTRRAGDKRVLRG